MVAPTLLCHPMPSQSDIASRADVAHPTWQRDGWIVTLALVYFCVVGFPLPHCVSIVNNVWLLVKPTLVSASSFQLGGLLL